MSKDSMKKSLDSLIENWGLCLSDNFSPKFTENYVSLNLPGCNRELRLVSHQIDKLIEKQKIDDINQLKYKDDCGFNFNNYSEILTNISHKDFSYLGLPSDWIADESLKFKIDSVSVEIGQVSDPFILLLEPIYYDSDLYQHDFHEYASIKLYGGDSEKHEEYCIKSLYYLNSHYLQKPDLYARIWHLESPQTNYDLLSTHIEVEDILRNLKSPQAVLHDDFISTEPLSIYNYACTLDTETSFLEFYRVLEFFFMSYQLTRISELRYDNSYSEKDILEELQIRNEVQFLKKMLHHTISRSIKSKLLKFAQDKDLIDGIYNFNNLVTKLYDFRNSIVHSKQEELNRTKIPNPFKPDNEIKAWSYITRKLADGVIQKLNHVSA